MRIGLAVGSTALYFALSSAMAQVFPPDQRSIGQQLEHDPSFQRAVRNTVDDEQRRQSLMTPQAPVSDGADAVDSAADMLAEILGRAPRNDFESYIHSQAQLLAAAAPPSKRSRGVHGYSSNPYSGKTPRELMVILRANFDRQNRATASHPSTGLETGTLGGLPLPERNRTRKSTDRPIADVPEKKDASFYKAEMVKKYPALAVAGSPLNVEFVARLQSYRATNAAYFDDERWPVKLATESIEAVASGKTIAAHP